MYASSFSKTVCPGIRVGYLVGPAALIKRIQSAATNTYISPNMVAQSIVNQFCRSGRIDDSIETVRTALRARRDALVEALRRKLPAARFTPPQGGYFMWVELPKEVNVADLELAARARGVVFVNGADFLPDGGGENTLRPAYSGVTPEQIDEGSHASRRQPDHKVSRPDLITTRHPATPARRRGGRCRWMRPPRGPVPLGDPRRRPDPMHHHHRRSPG